MTSPDPQSQRELLERAAIVVVTAQFGSTSTVQRKLRCGYATAHDLMAELERYKIVGPADGTKARDVLVARDDLDTVIDQIRGVA